MNMYWHEIRVYRKATLIWSLALIMLVALFLLIYPAFARNAEEVRSILSAYPAPVLAALGISPDTVLSFLGFYSLMFNYVLLCGSVQAMNLGISLTAREVNGRTAEFLLSKPVSRNRVLLPKLLAALSLLVFTNLLFLTAAWSMATAVETGPYSLRAFFLISLTLFLVQLVFLAVGLVSAVVLGRVRSVVALSLGSVFALFIINMFSSVVGDRALRFATPFRYFDPVHIMRYNSYEAPFVLTEAAVIVIAVASSFCIYSRKDIRV